MKLPALAMAMVFLTCAHQKKPETWPQMMKDRFFLPLTFPDEEWSPEDFGRQVSPSDLLLLEKWKPEVYVAEQGLAPVDFYAEYLPHTRLLNDGELALEQVSRNDLKRHERRAGFYLDYYGPHESCATVDCEATERVAYGRVYRETMVHPARPDRKRDYVILKYSFVFTGSGLPGELSWLQSLGAGIAGDIDVWHELDIHGATHVFLDAETLEARFFMLAQHNHFRTYLSAGEPIRVCFAYRSNEPYPCPGGDGVRKFRTVGDPSLLSAVLRDEDAGFTAGWDVVHGPQAGAKRIRYRVEGLPDRDPLYVSWIGLGDRLKILAFVDTFYRQGPPGIDMNTVPELKLYTDAAMFWFFKDGDLVAAELLDQAGDDFFMKPDVAPLLKHNGSRLFELLEGE